MSEDNDPVVFRQQRGKREAVSFSDITGEAPPEQSTGEASFNGASLSDVLAVQRKAGVNTPAEQEKAVTPPAYGSMGPRPKDGISVTGNIPPVMQQMLKQRLAEVNSMGEEDDRPVRQPQTGPAFSDPRQDTLPPMQPIQASSVASTPFGIQPGQVYTNDPALSALLGSINTQNYERIVLPSLGRFYTDPDQPSGGELHIRPMTGSEETILSTARFMRQGRGIEMIFRNCIQEKHVNPERMLSIDRTYLLIYLRAISYGNLYEVTIKCPECGHTFDHDIDLNLPVNFCPQNFTLDSLTKTLPRSGFVYRYRLMTGADENEVSTYRDRKTKFANSTDDSFLFRASMLIEEIGNGQVRLNNRYAVQTLLERLPVADVNHIRNALNNPPFGVKTEIPVNCISCGHEFPVELPYESNFFFPQEKPESMQL